MTKRKQKSTSPFSISKSKPTKDELTQIAKVPVMIDVLYGTTQINLYDFIKLKAGNIIELDQFFDEPLELCVNGEIIAQGELEKSEAGWGIRITSIYSKSKRLNNLGKACYEKGRK
ncbi:flagellar motor switch protein FliN [Legionella busanensis]|uniref:Flagellar motor switch protein FliN n=1 Tax=Legionella busanensis TaxID=190655 RepID=A0A378JLF0_9GAMM|nr:FliM/FliN family flagellar motor switch protein [Legionella busanensis]STX52024.1 flagellar motor switch protein FliN [Legionella busanensis]